MTDHLFADRKRMGCQGLTLVELLVAMAVMGLLVMMFAQMVTLTGQAISANAKTLDAAGQARLVFARLATDLAARPRRPDLGMLFVKDGSGTPGGNDSFQFYSEVDGYSGARHVACVGYRIQETNTGRIYQLERGVVGTDWGPAVGVNPLVHFLPNRLTASDNSDPNYEVLADDIFRLEFCYLLNTGLMSNSNGSKLSGNAAAGDYSNVVAIVVAVGVLDNKSRQILSDAQLQQLSQALPDTVDGQDPISGWNIAMAQSGFAPGVPSMALQGVCLYQRTFCVP